MAVTTATAKETFAKAVEWQVVGGCTQVTISDSIKTYSTDAFALAMALLDIAKTVNSATALLRTIMKHAAECPFAEPEKAARRLFPRRNGGPSMNDPDS